MKELINIQSELKAPKSQYNSFGKYKYRSCEDILEAVKPLLKKYNCTLVINDEIVMIGDHYYLKATATLTNEECIDATGTAYAREPESKSGMDAAQITGATSSYARKYALNGLFAIDDTKDADATNTHEETKPAAAPKRQATPKAAPKPTNAPNELMYAAKANECNSLTELGAYFNELAAQGVMTPELRTIFSEIKNKKFSK